MKRIALIALGVLLLQGCKDKGRIVEPKDGPAHMVIKETHYDYGTLTNGAGVVEHDFQIVNDGSEKLVITNVHPYCHCTKVDYPKEPIKPGHGALLKVYLDTHDLDPGHFTRTIDVHGSGRSGKVTILLTGDKI